MTNENLKTYEERIRTRRNAVKYLTEMVQDGKSVSKELSGICSDLKEKGLTPLEMNDFGKEFFDATWPIIKRRIEGYKEEYGSNPKLARQFSRKYGLIDFLPLIGFFTNENTNEKLKERQPFFYKWANQRSIPKLKNFAFKTYHWIGYATTLYAFMNNYGGLK